MNKPVCQTIEDFIVSRPTTFYELKNIEDSFDRRELVTDISVTSGGEFGTVGGQSLLRTCEIDISFIWKTVCDFISL